MDPTLQSLVTIKHAYYLKWFGISHLKFRYTSFYIHRVANLYHSAELTLDYVHSHHTTMAIAAALSAQSLHSSTREHSARACCAAT